MNYKTHYGKLIHIQVVTDEIPIFRIAAFYKAKYEKIHHYFRERTFNDTVSFVVVIDILENVFQNFFTLINF